MKALEEFLRPEFINRVDEIVCFNHLTRENFERIAELMLNELAAVMAERGYELSYDSALVSHLAEKSFSETYGARNLRRTIQKELEDVIASEIVDNHKGSASKISATAEDGKIKISVE